MIMIITWSNEFVFPVNDPDGDDEEGADVANVQNHPEGATDYLLRKN